MKDILSINQAPGRGRPERRLPMDGPLQKIMLFVTLFFLLAWPDKGTCGDASAFTEHRVKALFLLNFTKYVEWPANTFPDTNSPLVIGILGDEKFYAEVKEIINGKAVNGRTIEVHQVGREDDCAKCQILFISASEKKHTAEILQKIKGAPVLTVGETEQFTQQGGIINFIIKDGRVRLEIDLNAARLAKLELSSKLLSVADTVHGKP